MSSVAASPGSARLITAKQATERVAARNGIDAITKFPESSSAT